MTESPANVGETADAFTPMTVEEARALMTEAVTGLDRDMLLAERAEAEAQLRAAEATLGITPTAPNGEATAAQQAPEQEPDEAAQKTQDVDAPNGAATLDVDELRRAAAAARTADDELARAASEAERPPAGEAQLGTAESAFARALEIQEDLPAAWRRLVGALISGTGMAIVIGALGWNVYWLLVPIALIAILTVDLRLSGKAAREASAEAARGLPSVGVEGTEGLDRIRLQRTQMEEAEGRLAFARADRDAAYARFDELAPGRRPSEVEEIIAEYEAERAAQAEAEAETARAEAERAAQAEAEAETARAEAERAAQAAAEAATAEVEAAAQEETAAQAEAETATAEPEAATQEEAAAQTEAEAAQVQGEAEAAAQPPVTAPEPAAEAPVTASEWWFGSKEAPAPPPAASAPVRALAERLSAEGREALARVEAQLAALDRVELAKRSLEWHEANGSTERGTEAPPEEEIRGG